MHKPAAKTELYAAMLSSGRYSPSDAIEAIEAMREAMNNGCDDPDELLHEEGFEPDYVFDIIDI